MAIKLSNEPPTAAGVVADALDDIRGSAMNALGGGSGIPTSSSALLRVNPQTLTTTIPHPVYDLGVDAIVAGHGLEAATLNGWRYVLEDAGHAFAFAELDGAGKEFTSFNTGAFPLALCDALAEAEHLDYVKNADWELRVLRVPALYVYAIWLHNDKPEHDLLIPVPRVSYGLVANKPYAPADFLNLLLPPAKQAATSAH